MNKVIAIIAAILLVCGIAATETRAWDESEHRQLGDSVYRTVMGKYCLPSADGAFLLRDAENIIVLSNKVWHGMTFGQLCARFARDDLARDRFHDRGKTILQQLQVLTPEMIDDAWQDISSRPAYAFDPDSVGALSLPPETSPKNVVSAYLLYHLLALRMAQSAGESQVRKQRLPGRAIALEAVAQGYLADAFSAGHILTPVSDRLAPLHPRNTRETHDHFRNEGVYVINSRGEAWQTFGDRLLHWYAPTYRPVFEACCFSLTELLAVMCGAAIDSLSPGLEAFVRENAPHQNAEATVSSWLESRRGDRYYSELRVPTLVRLPMPVAATWSLRTNIRDEHGIRRRFHFPQLREVGLNDPGLIDIDHEFLYRRSAVPDWLIPPPFLDRMPADPDSLARFHPDWASIVWVQNRYAPPSYKGMLSHLGGQLMSTGGKYQSGGMIGVGYGFWDDLLVIRDVSADITLFPSVYEPKRFLLVSTAGFGFPLAVATWLKSLRLDGGVAFGLRSDHKRGGGVLAIGLDSKVWPLRWTNIGLTCRLKYQWFFLDHTFHGPALELIFQ